MHIYYSMKKLVPFVLAVILLAGCTPAPIADDNTVQSTANIEAVLPDNTPAASEETPPPTATPLAYGDISNIHINFMTDDVLSRFDSYEVYGEYVEGIVIWTDKAIRDFAFISVSVDDSLNITPEALLYTVVTLLPETPFVARTVTPETIPLNGIQFTDKDNNTKYYYIGYNGKDGLLMLVEF